MEENQPVPSYFLEATPKRDPGVRFYKFATLEDKIEAMLTGLKAEWKKQALHAVSGLLETPSTPVTRIPSATPTEIKELLVTNQRLTKIAQTQHEQLTGIITKYGRLQEVFREQELQAILLEAAYSMCVRSKEAKDFIFTKYVDTLRFKIEDLTRVAELDALLEFKGIDISKGERMVQTVPFTQIPHAQLEELSRVLLVNDGAGSTSNIGLSDEERSELLAHMQ
ncbi:hypothetical protein R1sor_018264 [Riccia sorocarpa]|uniref:Uncharacterized protein n=1 Tax=Riccia sorocarpa TaxID=122646 RepID=A0ABD3IDA3_9MARC